eukprot:4526639-Pyramimonas_sp.AAC.3
MTSGERGFAPNGWRRRRREVEEKDEEGDGSCRRESPFPLGPWLCSPARAAERQRVGMRVLWTRRCLPSQNSSRAGAVDPTPPSYVDRQGQPGPRGCRRRLRQVPVAAVAHAVHRSSTQEGRRRAPQQDAA